MTKRPANHQISWGKDEFRQVFAPGLGEPGADTQ
jgi:hypothetical protein